jgi:ribose transport system substrate-binding protein
MGGSAKIGIVGALNSFIQNQRQKGFEDTIKSNPDVTVVGVVDGRNIQDNALAAAETLITGNPDMTAVYATGEPALVGAVAAVEAQGATDRIKVVGWDLTAQVIKGIDDGFVIAVVQQDPERMGAVAVESALTLINGGTVDPVIPVPVTIVTKDNVDKFRTMFQ